MGESRRDPVDAGAEHEEAAEPTPDAPASRVLPEHSIFRSPDDLPEAAQPVVPSPEPPAAPVPARRRGQGEVPATPVAPKVVTPQPVPAKPVPAKPVPAKPVPAQPMPPHAVKPKVVHVPSEVGNPPVEPPRPLADAPTPNPDRDWGHTSAAQSVLTRIEEKAGEIPRVMLQEAPSEPSPLVMANSTSVPSGRALDHYDLVGEIGRGAVGVILKGRDVDLGRDVAIKLLRDEYANRQDVAQRFVEEAQISGQLQHPGIAPLYELGIHPDGRPYFAMKLIKGRTFSGLLNDRHDVTKGRHYLLGIFEHVCQAMAYAHSRGVIHRDLKPSNIMVGAFGEVQVMDWGFAKVLSRGGVADERSAQRLHSVHSVIETVRTGGSMVGSQSLAGSLMGTPPYMSPEQASGEIDVVDARSDVFSLGAVLCEILTGMPPYVAENPEGGVYEVVKLASQARLGPAKERLASCGASEELVQICLGCLTPARAARPADAGVLTKEISSYLAAVDERAHKSQLAAVAERGRAATAQAKADAAAKAVEQERRARRLTLGLGTAVLAILLVGGGAFLLFQSQRKARQAELASSVSTRLEEAARLQGLARNDAVGDLTHWTAAVTAAEGARDLATESGGSDELVSRANAALAGIQGEAADAQRDADQAARDHAMVQRLEDLRAQKGDDFRPLAAEDHYTAAFGDYGIDIDKTPVDEAGAKVAASNIAPALVAALDEWSWVRAYGTVDKSLLRRPLEVARVADDDAWRSQLRRAIQRGDGGELSRLARTQNVSELSATSVHLLASALANEKNYEGAVKFLRRAQVHHPKDLWINFYLGYWLTQLTPPRWEEAARAYSAAIAIRPQGAPTWNNLGIALQSRGALDEAIAAYRRAIQLRPEYASAHNNLGTAWMEQKDYGKALDAFQQAVKIQSNNGPAWYGIGAVLQQRGQDQDAIEAYKKAKALRPDLSQAHVALVRLLGSAGRSKEILDASAQAVKDSPNAAWAHRNYAFALWAAGDRTAALKHYDTAVTLDPQDAVARHNYGVAKGWVKDWQNAIQHIEAACELAPDDASYRASLGWVFSQMGDWGGAIREFTDALRMDPSLFMAHDELGSALLKTGDYDGAQRCYVKAVEVDPTHSNRIAYQNLGRLLGARMSGPEAEAFYKREVTTGTREGRVTFLKNLRNVLVSAKMDYEGALAVNRTARKLEGEDAELWMYEGQLLRVLGKFDQAIESLERSVDINPNSPVGHSQLGLALQAAGRFDEALESIDTGHEIGITQKWSYDSKSLLEKAQRYVELFANLEGRLKGATDSRAYRDAAELAFVCAATDHWGSAATIYKSLLEDTELEDSEFGPTTQMQARYDAIRMAARAGTELGDASDPHQPNAAGRAAWRKQALTWLQELFTAYRELMRNANAPERVRGLFRRWKLDPDLAGIRDENRLRSLSPDEREELRAFWMNLDAALVK